VEPGSQGGLGYNRGDPQTNGGQTRPHVWKMASRSHSLRALEQPPAAGEREADGEAFSRSQSAPIAIDARDRRKLECGKNGSNSSADDSSASSSFERVVSAADTRRNVFSSQRDVSSPLSPADCSVESATSTPETAEGASCLGGGSIEGYRQPGKKWKTGRKYEVMEGLQFMALSDLGKLEEVLAWERSTGHSLDSSFFSLEKYTRSVFEGEGGSSAFMPRPSLLSCTCTALYFWVPTEWSGQKRFREASLFLSLDFVISVPVSCFCHLSSLSLLSLSSLSLSLSLSLLLSLLLSLSLSLSLSHTL
jgi:hypothetical protein